MKLRLFLLASLSLLFSLCHAQYYSSGADPASTNWWQIKTPHFQIIFPAQYEAQAQKVARHMDYAYDYVAKSMNSKPQKLSIIIHTQTANSNGLVAWAPRRMELWTVPSQDAFNYSQEWMEQLVIHETRHFVQANKVNQGMTKLLKVILGQQAEMIPLAMKTRPWFMEGDAVATETALSHSGRGRMPSFEQGLRALTLEKGKQSYDVALLGSYKKYVPDHYEVGYHTVAVNRLYRDSALFDDKMERIGRGFSGRGFRDNRKIKYYGFAIDYLENEWRKQDEALVKTPYKSLTPEYSDYLSYRFLQADEGKYYAVRSSFGKIPEVVEIDSLGNEHVVAVLGYMSEPDFSIKNGLLVYTDELPDARWEQRSYADLFMFDLRTGKKKRLTKKQVLQSPHLSADGQKIVAQWTDGLGAYALRIYDANSGRMIKQFPNPKNQFYFSPTWSADGTHIIYVAQEKDKKSLKILDDKSEKEELLVEGTYGEMAHPVCNDEYAYFTASYSGINNIYRCDLNNKEVIRMTSARFGADYAAISGPHLAYANYTSDGYRPVKHIVSDVAGENLMSVKDMGLGLGDKLTQQEGGAIDFSLAPQQKYELKNYSRLGHLLHFHSWFPLIPVEATKGGVSDMTAEDGRLYPYISFLSQNKLSTSYLTATYNGNPARSDQRYKLNYTYEGFYPQLSIDASWGDVETASFPVDEIKVMRINPSISLPLSFKNGVYSYSFRNSLFGEYTYLERQSDKFTLDYFSRGFSSSFVRAKQRAKRDLYSPSFQLLSFYMAYDDSEMVANKYRKAFTGRLGVPGVVQHHSLQLSYHWQQKDVTQSNVLASLPRGYTSISNNEISYASLDYYLPLAYPDIHLGSLMNMKRITMGLYAEMATMHNGMSEDRMVGAGGSLVWDLNFLRYNVDVKLGVQMGVSLSSENNKLQRPCNLVLNFNVF